MPDKIFFSYSRHDSVFALKLAKDLRHAGAIIWLDQLDIPPGKHWDSVIGEALENSNCLLAILSPKSLLSNNAMDEISYALEENKKVIPILLTTTETPFRLRRLQRVDFTGDYDTAFSQLLNAIDIEKSPLSKREEPKPKETGSNNIDTVNQDYFQKITSPENLNKVSSSQKEPAPKLSTLQATDALKSGDKNAKSRTIIMVSLILLLGLAGWAVFQTMNKGAEAKNIDEKLAQTPQTTIDKKDSLIPEHSNNLSTTIDKRKVKPDSIELSKKVVNSRAKVEVLPEEVNKQPQTLSADENNTTISTVLSGQSSGAKPPEKDPVSIQPPPPRRDSLPPSPTDPPPGEVKPTPNIEKTMIIATEVRIDLKLMESPDFEKGRALQPVKFSVSKNVVIDGVTIIKEGSIANGSMKVGMRFIGLRIDQVQGTNGKMIPLKSKESDLKHKEVKKDNTYYAIIKKGTTVVF